MKKISKPSDERAVFELEHDGRIQRVEATAVRELRDILQQRLSTVMPYSVQAASHLAFANHSIVTTPATPTTPEWTVRRIGTMTFQPDPLREPLLQQQKRRRKAAPMTPHPTVTPPEDDGQVQNQEPERLL